MCQPRYDHTGRLGRASSGSGHIVQRNDYTIIPKALQLQSNMLKIVHESHQWLERCKERAKAVMYWPGMTEDIDRVVNQCRTCLRFRRSNTKEPLLPHALPTSPWEELGVDIMTLKAI